MKIKKISFTINSFYQASELVRICIEKDVLPIIFIKNILIENLGIDWLRELNSLLQKDFNRKDYNFFIDCKNNYGLLIFLVEYKVEYLKIIKKKETFAKLSQIAKKNKVILNPKFSVVNLDKIKDIEKKIKLILKF